MPDLLTVDERGGANVQINRYVGLFNPTALSGTFGTALAGGVAGHAVRQQVIVLNATTQYFCNWEGLYKSTDGGATFVIDKLFANPASAVDQRLSNAGIHLAYDNGSDVLYLCGARVTVLGGWMVGWRLNIATDVFQETISVLFPAASYIVGDVELYNNVLHFTDGNGSSNQILFSWDPISQSMASYAAPWLQCSSQAYSILNDGLLYLLGKDAAANDFRLARFTGTWGAVVVVSSHGAVVSAGLTSQRPAIFTDPTTGDAVLFTLIENGSTVGWNVNRLPPPYDGTGITTIQTTVLAGHPTLLTNADGGAGTNNGDKRCFVIIDTETTPGTTRIFLAFANDVLFGTPFSFYEWQGFGGPITFVGAGGNVHNGICTPTNGGARFWVPGQLKCRMIDPVRDGVPGGQRLHFVGTGGGTHSVRFRRAKNGQDVDGPLAKLVGPVTGGGSLGTNQVDNHPFDGVTVGTVVWDLANDTPPFAGGETNTIIVPESVA